VERVVAIDLVAVRDLATGRHLKTLAWGDHVELTAETSKQFQVRLTVLERQSDDSMLPVRKEGRIAKRANRPALTTAGKARVLKADFVDVQQGDGAVLETPSGQVVLIDGGDNQLFARYLAARYRGSSDKRPKRIDCIVVSHGDADHFAGLSKLRDSEDHDVASKRLFLHPERVFHNGLVKRPSNRPEQEQLGETVPGDGRPLIVGLEDDLREVPDKEMNRPFREWKATLKHWARRGPIDVRRLERGDGDRFDFLKSDGVDIEVLGPIPRTIGGRTGLPFLGTPRRRFGHPSQQPQTSFGTPSASHTINGHSIVLRVGFGRWHMLFAGDLNEESERTLADEHAAGTTNLRSEVLKVPHHGSADFLFDFVKAVEPLVSVVSSGDESPRKEYIHPRATLMAGLGRFGRQHEPVIFVTELVAFFTAEGWVNNVPVPGDKRISSDRNTPFFAFSREAYGTVRIRTDGTRLLVYTDSGLADKKEAYAFTLADDGSAVPQEILRV
jgi:beta-lactamase superfamily II metal-dependent hydrolase